jgi:hypothetical protein
MPAKPRMFTEPEVAYIKDDYFKRNLMTREIYPRLNAHFGTDYSSKQVSRAINDRGWPEQRKILHAKADSRVELLTREEQTKLVRARTKEGVAEVQDDVSKRVTNILDKALTMAESSRSAKDLQSALGAVNISYNLFAKANNIGAGVGGGNTFNFNFSKGAGKVAERVVESVTGGSIDIDSDS